MKLKEIIHLLEDLAPPAYQESYDNSGLITGDSSLEITGALICLDSTEAVLDEAIKKNCNLVIAHHPIVFSGLKKINGKNYVERVIIKAIKNDIAIYAIHTNLDNISRGVNAKICEKLGIKNPKILSPIKESLRKLVTFVPAASADKLRNGLFDAGAGQIGNYDQCSFNLEGKGTFRGNDFSNPVIGTKNKRSTEPEERIEVIYEKYRESQILFALRTNHPYEEIAYDIYSLENDYQLVGAGMVGELEQEMTAESFLNHLKNSMKTDCIRYTRAPAGMIKKVAVCGGSGSFLLPKAISAGAQVFVSADFKYHQFFDADDKIMIADIGHFESEQFTIDLLAAHLREKITKFAVHLTVTNTNPINYI